MLDDFNIDNSDNSAQMHNIALTGVCELIGAAYLMSFCDTSSWLYLAAICNGVKPFCKKHLQHFSGNPM